MSRETNIAKSEWRVRGSEVWGMRTRGHKRDRLEDSSIAYASQPPGTYIDDALEIVALIAEAGTVLHETGLTPRALSDRVKTLEQACQKQNESICQTLGNALGYPRYCDDQANFPGATEADGVCTGDHVAESLATAATERIRVLEGERAEVLLLLTNLLQHHDNMCTGIASPDCPTAEECRVLIAKLEGTQGK